MFATALVCSGGVAIAACLVRPALYDEATFYLPAIRAVVASHRLSTLFRLAMPGPTGWIAVEAGVCRWVGCGLGLLRFPTVGLWLALGGLLLVDRARTLRNREWTVGELAILLSLMWAPYAFRDAARLGGRVPATIFGVLFVVEAGQMSRSPKLRLAIGAALLVGAVACDSTAAAVVAFVLAESLLEFAKGRRGSALRGAMVTMPAVLFLGILVIAWGGLQSPVFRRSFPDIPAASLFQPRPLQILLGLFEAGLLVAPVVPIGKVRWTVAACLTAPLAAIFVASGALNRGDVYGGHFSGLGSELCRALASRSVILSAVIGGAIAALGAAFLCVPSESRGESRTRLFVLVFMAMMCFVPFLFERYYMPMVVISYGILWSNLPVSGGQGIVTARRFGIAAVGFAYAVVEWFSVLPIRHLA